MRNVTGLTRNTVVLVGGVVHALVFIQKTASYFIYNFIIIKGWTESKNIELFSSLCVQDKRHMKTKRQNDSEDVVHSLSPGLLFFMAFKPVLSVGYDIIPQITLLQQLPVLIHFLRIIYIYLAFSQFNYQSQEIPRAKSLQLTGLSDFNKISNVKLEFYFL